MSDRDRKCCAFLFSFLWECVWCFPSRRKKKTLFFFFFFRPIRRSGHEVFSKSHGSGRKRSNARAFFFLLFIFLTDWVGVRYRCRQLKQLIPTPDLIQPVRSDNWPSPWRSVFCFACFIVRYLTLWWSYTWRHLFIVYQARAFFGGGGYATRTVFVHLIVGLLNVFDVGFFCSAPKASCGSFRVWGVQGSLSDSFFLSRSLALRLPPSVHFFPSCSLFSGLYHSLSPLPCLLSVHRISLRPFSLSTIDAGHDHECGKKKKSSATFVKSRWCWTYLFRGKLGATPKATRLWGSLVSHQRGRPRTSSRWPIDVYTV